MAFPLPRGDLSSNTTNIIREQETPSPFGCGYAALCNRGAALDFLKIALDHGLMERYYLDPDASPTGPPSGLAWTPNFKT